MFSGKHSGKLDNNTRSHSQHSARRLTARLKKTFSGHDTAVCKVLLAEAQQAPAATLSAASDSTSNEVRVAILVNHSVGWGDRIAVVGQDKVLGCWQPGQSLPLSWSEGDVWRAEVGLPPGVHEFKCLTIRNNGQLEWELGSNRIIEVPPSLGGVFEARCSWADTASTVLQSAALSSSTQDVAMLAVSNGNEADLSDGFCTCSSESGGSVNADGSLRSYRLDLPPSLPASDGPSRSATVSNSGGCSEIEPAGVSKGVSLSMYEGVCSVSADGAPQQLSLDGSCSDGLASAGSSGDVSMYTAYDAAGPFATFSGSRVGSGAEQQLPPLPRPPQQPSQQQRGNPLTAASLKQAAAEAAAAAAATDAATGGAGMRAHGSRNTISVSSSPLSALNSAVDSMSLLSPVGTDVSGQLPARAISSSTLSFSSLEVSEAVDDSCGALSEEGLALATPDSAFGGSSEAGSSRLDDGQAPGAADAAVLLDEQLFANPCAFEQLMAVEPGLLLLEQQQQLLIEQQAEATIEAARHSSSGSSVFASSTAAAAAAAAEEQQALFDAAAELAELDSNAGMGMQYLPTEETLPPTALARFRGLSEIQEGDDEELLDDYPSTAAPAGPKDLDDLIPDAPLRRASTSSCSSSSSRLSKDQLPMLGLTVNVPSAAATTAAQISAASKAAEAAAAAAAAAKARPGQYDGVPHEAPTATEGLRLSAAAHIIPHVDKVHTGGEDAFFISNAGHGALGVSDGVSAWAEDGIDPGEYSRTLVQYCAEAFEERVLAAATAINKGAFITKFDPRGILRYAQQCTCKPGSATMVLAALQPGGQLHVANLGDCGVKVVREGRVVFETKPQQHDFNLPYQLSHPQLFPDTDTADSADRYTWQVQEGDVIVAASDGLYDNLWDEELIQLLQQGLLGIQPLDSASSLSRVDSTASLGSAKGGRKLGLRGKHSRSNSTSQLPTLLSGSSNAMPVFAAAAAVEETSTEADAQGKSLTRSRSTSYLSSWGAKQFRSWKNKSSGKLQQLQHHHSAAAAMPSVEQQEPQPLRTMAEVTAADIARAAELVAAAAAAHAADKEFKSPWSVAAGRAYGLLARLFAKGGKMDDITCVVAVVQDAGRKASAQPAAAPASQGSDVSAATVAAAGNRSSSDLSPSDDSSIGACLTSEGSDISAAALDEMQ